jgi:hypothetical protein
VSQSVSQQNEIIRPPFSDFSYDVSVVEEDVTLDSPGKLRKAEHFWCVGCFIASRFRK